MWYFKEITTPISTESMLQIKQNSSLRSDGSLLILISQNKSSGATPEFYSKLQMISFWSTPENSVSIIKILQYTNKLTFMNLLSCLFLEEDRTSMTWSINSSNIFHFLKIGFRWRLLFITDMEINKFKEKPTFTQKRSSRPFLTSRISL